MRKAILLLAKVVGIAVPSRPQTKSDYLTYAEAAKRALAMLVSAEKSKHEQARVVGGNALDRQVLEVIDALSKAFTYNPSWTLKHILEATHAYLQTLHRYYTLLASGAPLEDARYVLPNAVKTRIIFTMNARELLESFLPLRMCTRAQWEIRLLAWKVWKILYRIHPEIFAYAGPRCILLDLRARKTPCTLQDYLEASCEPAIEQCPEKTPQRAIPACIRAAHGNVKLY